jgi:hypothetical protein
MPIIVNVTILNGMDVVGEIVGQVIFVLFSNKRKTKGRLCLISPNGIHKILMVNILN